jgi:hypothetical protein
MTSLKELEAVFLRREVCQEMIETTDSTKMGDRVYMVEVATLAEADGVEFLCPLCFAKNKGKVGTHVVICWFVGKVPDDADPGPGRWTPEGTGIDDLTLSPSVNLDIHTPEYYKEHPKACRWHGWVKNGDAT